MAYQGYPFPYDLTNLLGGAVRVVYAPVSTAIPTKPSDIFQQVRGATPPYYALKTGWNEFGAASDAFAYGRSIELGSYTIQQVTGDVLEEVTSTTRTARLSIAEIRPETLKIIEEGQDFNDITTSAALATTSSKTGAFTGTGFGTISELSQYRIAFVARRAKQAGVVVEKGATTPADVERGRFFVGVGYRCQLTADNVEMAMARGELTNATVTFHFFPDPDSSLTTGNEFGIWWDEQAGNILN